MATIHGDNVIFQSSRTAIYDLLVLLKTAMDSAVDDPRPSAVYNTHDVVKMSLPAVSVDFDGAEDVEEVIGSTDSGQITVRYEILCSVRVHTAFSNGFRNMIKLGRLLNSVNNYFNTNRNFHTAIDASTNVRFQISEIGEVVMDEEYDESFTIGGSLKIKLIITVCHTQL